jgi:hypothetical protein
MTLEHWTNLDINDQKKILKALDQLAKDNPDIAQQLTKLADLKNRKPATFKAALEKLNKL